MQVRPFREPARLLFHLGEGYTRVPRTRFENQGPADGSSDIDLPTHVTPPHLRALGSRFLVIGQHVTPEDDDRADDLRAAVRAMHVEELR